MAHASSDAPSPEAVVAGVLAAVPGTARRLAPAEWGLTLEVAGWPLDVGLVLRDRLLAVSAYVLAAERIDPHDLLHRHRGGPYVRFCHTRAGEVWLRGELPAAGLEPRELDRLLSALVQAAEAVRGAP